MRKVILSILLLSACNVGNSKTETANTVTSNNNSNNQSGVPICDARIEQLPEGRCSVVYQNKNGGICDIKIFDSLKGCEGQVEEEPSVEQAKECEPSNGGVLIKELLFADKVADWLYFCYYIDIII